MKDSAWHIETRKLGSAIKDDKCGYRLDEYLAEHFPFFSRSGWQREINAGVVFVNDSPARKPAQRLRRGDELCRLHPFDEEPEVDTNLKIIWNDGDVAAVYKPAGLPMHESGRYRRRTVAGVLPQVLGPTWGYVHRLDRETSGILLCARTPEIRQLMVDAWTKKKVQKTYLAIVRGTPTEDHWRVDQPIHAVRHEHTNRAVIAEDGEDAVTLFSTVKRGKGMALIEARPLTGRTNQIRLHAEFCGFPLIGDKVYGADPMILEIYRKEGNSLRVQEMAGYPRHALHAWKIGFYHPHTNVFQELECPIADDLKPLTAQL